MFKRFTFETILASAVAVAVVTSAAWHVPAAAQVGATATQSSVDKGVTVKATLKKLAGPEWEFVVVLDSHVEELKDDLAQTAVLLVDGREIRPSQWQAPGSGGHHREGVLRFPAAGANPLAIELRIQRAGETGPRVFRWEGAALK